MKLFDDLHDTELLESEPYPTDALVLTALPVKLERTDPDPALNPPPRSPVLRVYPVAAPRPDDRAEKLHHEMWAKAVRAEPPKRIEKPSKPRRELWTEAAARVRVERASERRKRDRWVSGIAVAVFLLLLGAVLFAWYRDRLTRTPHTDPFSAPVPVRDERKAEAPPSAPNTR